MRLAYDGTHFHGWQRQPNATSVQQTLEEAMKKIWRSPIVLTGAGRTDAGVHAREMFAHFDLPPDITIDKKKNLNSLNILVGRDISVYDFLEVNENAHTRFDASERTYKYFVSFIKNPFIKDYSLFLHKKPDFDLMNEAAKKLCSINDFSSFAKLHSDNKTNICKVTHAQWEVDDNLFLPCCHFKGAVFTITADRFLRNMVRAIVGTLLDVGRGKISLGAFEDIISSKERGQAGESVEPQGLFLWKINYPYFQDE